MTDSDVRPTPRDRRARVGASGAFAVQGLALSAVLARVPVLQDTFALDDLQLTAILAAVPVIAGVGSVVAGIAAPRTGSALVLRVSGLGVCATAAVIGLASSLPMLCVAVGLFGFFLGAVDATMNIQGVAVQRRYGRSILASCHAWWSVAGITAALAAIAAANVSLPIFLGAVAIVGAAVSLAVGPRLLTRADEAANPPTAVVETGTSKAVRSGRVVLFVGVALMVMFIGDAATTNWSGVFLQDVLDASAFAVPAGLFAYLVCQFLGRTVGDRVIGRLGAVTTVVAGSVAAATGFGVVAAAPDPAVAIVGFALVGAGLSIVVPLTFSAADALTRPVRES